MDYIDQQFEAYLQEELKVKRNLYNYSDRCVNGYHKIGLTIKTFGYIIGSSIDLQHFYLVEFMPVFTSLPQLATL